jgi:N-acetylglucosaminyldiphosphoundecaprenol N-acetyl-beta-D-mannosaminyltransferase
MSGINDAKSHDTAILNIPFVRVNESEIAAQITQFIQPTIVVTPNIDHIVRAYHNHHLKELYVNADLCINDSRVLSFLLKSFFYITLPAVPGSDLTRKLLTSTAINNRTIAIVGGDILQIEKLKLEVIKNDKVIVKHINPPMNFYGDEVKISHVLDFIQASNADFIFLAIGSPQQEIIAHRVKLLLNKGVILCVGASIDYLTGKERRAPIWMQRLYMEWFFRFLQSPQKRFKRYFISCPKIFYILWKERKNVKKCSPTH